MTVAVLVVLLFFWTIAQVLLLVFAGLLLAVFLSGLAKPLSARTPAGRGWSLALVGLGSLIVLGLAGWFLVPRVAGQLDQLSQDLPQSIDRLEQQLQQYGWGTFLLDHVPTAENILSGRQSIWSRMSGIASTALGILANLVIIVFSGIYLAANPDL